MRRQLILFAPVLLISTQGLRAHALFPGQQTIHTAAERGIAYFQTTNEGRSASEYRVEVFDYDDWRATRHAVASPEKIVVPASSAMQGGSSVRRFTVMVDLDGARERVLRVCTKSIASILLRPTATSVNTRVCSKLIVRRLQ